MRTAVAFLVVCSVAATMTVSASNEAPTDIPGRAKGAQKVVVATVSSVRGRFATNQWGDQLIVSDAVVDVEETLKGTPAPSLFLTVEGGSVGDLTLTVSDMPELEPGQRGVFFLEERGGTHVLHGREQGLLRVDRRGRVEGTDLTLEAVGRQVRQGR